MEKQLFYVWEVRLIPFGFGDFYSPARAGINNFVVPFWYWNTKPTGVPAEVGGVKRKARLIPANLLDKGLKTCKIFIV